MACAPLRASAQDQDDEPDPMVLGIALADAPVTLEGALRIAEQRGTPISARFGMPDGDLQLSVYAIAQNGFIDILIDPKSSAIAAAHPLTDPDELANAVAQKRALEMAKLTLRAATEKALANEPGSHAISASPGLRDGQPVAVIMLLRDGNFMTVPEKLN